MKDNFSFLLICFALFFATNFINAQKADSDLELVDTSKIIVPPIPKEPKIFPIVEDLPYFKGCGGERDKQAIQRCSEGKLAAFIYTNLKYPLAAFKNGIGGQVFVQFVIEKDGSITAIELVHDIGYGCGEEALRIIHMIKEQELYQIRPSARGSPVRLLIKIPICFDLTNVDQRQ